MSLEQQEYSQEDIQKFNEMMVEQKKQLLKFYKDELPLVRLQAEYEKLTTEIEIAKLEKLKIKYTLLSLSEKQDEPSKKDVEELKTEKQD